MANKLLNRGLMLAGLAGLVGVAVTVSTTLMATPASSDSGVEPQVESATAPDRSGCAVQRGGAGGGAKDSGGRDHHGRGRLISVGLTVDQKLVIFDVDAPGKAWDIGTVSDDLEGDTYLLGIDYRVQNGELYGVGNVGGIYLLDLCNIAAEKVSQLTVTLQGKYFGVDFNPAADRLRIISDAGQNLRHDVNPDGATIEDGTLTYPPAPETATGLSGAAYTNNDLDPATATTLFDLDTNLNQVALQSPANSGQLAATGQLGVEPHPNAGFDIYSTVRDGRTVAVQGFAALDANGHRSLYKINILTGAADKAGNFPKKYNVTDLALPLNQL
ncbi:DUF4394 domain-containing protein [Solwaraspora sp. WMMD406]|uniref:DUF4394 domain-containing protein n=1 Tax=Solwaraspora sp. WMMD406 TaxID=3016095 RepID=UPI002417234F|nr:DUF4394 domain-containing protein [Solwaraspora sp. WMMD406]MDG4767036.1 DUF4394 domain-containing protein [Solwaraspora sp. WMMD406]